MKSGIYKITNKQNNKTYIGSAVYLTKRFSRHKRFLDRGIHENQHLQYAWDKYKSDAFEFTIIEYCNPDMLLIREQFYIDKYNPDYNICRIVGSHLGIKRSDATRKKLSLSLMGKNKGKSPSIETRKKLSIAMHARKLSSEHKRKIGLASSQRKHTEATKKLISLTKTGKPHPHKGHCEPCTSEHALKISLSNKGRKFSDSHKANLVLAWEKRKERKCA
jgi:group I intron endonuclease